MVCIPEVPFELEDVARTVTEAYIKGKSHCIICVAEGAQHHTPKIAAYLEKRREEGEAGFQVEVTILGQIQRGGSPSAFDRLLASRLGAAAVQRLVDGHQGEMVGLSGNDVVATPLSEVVDRHKPIDINMFRLGEMLAR